MFQNNTMSLGSIVPKVNSVLHRAIQKAST